MRQIKARNDNSTYPKGGVSCSKDTFLQAVSSVLRIKFSGENPTVRVAAKRQVVKKLRIPKTQQDKISKFWFSGILL
jgi:hypothetical protein